MQKYSVGIDELNDGELFDLEENSDIDWIIYDYEDYGYEGSGWALVRNKNDIYLLYNLSHCSCYGPLDNTYIVRYNSWTEITANSCHALFEVPENIWQKAQEIMS